MSISVHIMFSALSDEEKSEIRGQLLLSFNEPVSQVLLVIFPDFFKKIMIWYLILQSQKIFVI